jgi:3-hydroxyisobutyrate dehydrogenase-like beta-hydroxyacid dehydrogenase
MARGDGPKRRMAWLKSGSVGNFEDKTMKRVGVIGLGDMGSGLAKNLVKAGFETWGSDLSEQRLAAFADLGGRPAASAREVGAEAEAVFVMVMNGDQAKSVILGEDGLVRSLKPGAVVILTATIRASEARAIAKGLEGTGIQMIDSPVSGGYEGAQSGTLTMMAAAKKDVFEANQDVLQAVGGRIFHVGEEVGQGQTIKACLQGLIGSIFTATFESAVLAAKSGIGGQVLYDVFSNSGASNGITNNALRKILDRAFVGTGSHIATMYKDLTITMDMAREEGVPMFTAGAAMQLFQCGKTKHPEGDNWIVTKVLEDIAGTEVKW